MLGASTPAAAQPTPAGIEPRLEASPRCPPDAAGAGEPCVVAGNRTDPPADPFDLDAQYFLDGGAVPFVYVAGGVAIAAQLGSPPAEPLAFSPSEGGAAQRADTVPGYSVAALSGALTLTLGAFDRKARWHHVKGMFEAVVTTTAVTQLAKLAFGRRRPDYDPQRSSIDDDRMSFFSMHSSVTAASTVYLGLYLRQHAFKPWRGDRAIAWWELPAYASLAAIATYVPYSRVADRQHHVSDVLAGSAIGTGLAVAFYAFQEGRFRKAASEHARALTLVPWTSMPGASIGREF
jgi:membrane-associated phospholipid phosphatase